MDSVKSSLGTEAVEYGNGRRKITDHLRERRKEHMAHATVVAAWWKKLAQRERLDVLYATGNPALLLASQALSRKQFNGMPEEAQIYLQSNVSPIYKILYSEIMC